MPYRGHDTSEQAAHTASIHRAAGSTQPSPSPVRAVAGSPAVEPSSAQAIRRTSSNAAAAGLMSRPKTGVSTRTDAQPGGVRPTAAQPNAGRAGQLCRATSGLLQQQQRAAAIRATAHSSKAAASTPAEQSVAEHKEASSQTMLVLLHKH